MYLQKFYTDKKKKKKTSIYSLPIHVRRKKELFYDFMKTFFFISYIFIISKIIRTVRNGE